MEFKVINPSEIPESYYNQTVGLDIETEDLYIDSPICLISIYKPGVDVCYVIPVDAYDGRMHITLPDYEVEILKNFLSTIKSVGHNLQFDLSRIKYHYGVQVKLHIDTFLIARIFQMEKQGLKDLATMIKPELLPKIRKFKEIAQPKPPFVYNIQDLRVVTYSGLDAYLPFVVIRGLSDKIQSHKKIVKIEMDFLNTAIEMNANGLPFNVETYKKVISDYSQELVKMQTQLNEIAGWEVRHNSTADLRELLIDQCGLEPTELTPKGEPSMKASALERMKDNCSEENKALIDLILEIKTTFSVVNSSKKLLDFMYDGNLHFQVEQIGWDGTGRIYTKDTSVNQLTKPMRYAVEPSKGKKYVMFDWKCAELAIALYWSRCSLGWNWYLEGRDLHTEVMKQLLGKEEVTKQDRAVSKVLSFCTIYGGSERTVMKDLGCSYNEAEKFLKDYADLFPEVMVLRGKVHQFARVNGFTKTINGRIRKLSGINSDIQYEREKAERQAFNTAVQSSCADFAKIAMARVFNKYPGVRVAFHVFDSFLLEVPEEMSLEEASKIAEEMSDFTDRFEGFKLRFDIAEGPNWGACQEQL